MCDVHRPTRKIGTQNQAEVLAAYAQVGAMVSRNRSLMFNPSAPILIDDSKMSMTVPAMN
jgi:hypothetical protein